MRYALFPLSCSEGLASTEVNKFNRSLFLLHVRRHGTELRGQQQHQPADSMRTVRYVSLIDITSIESRAIPNLSLICMVVSCSHESLLDPRYVYLCVHYVLVPRSNLHRNSCYATRLLSRHSFDGWQGCCESQIRVHEAGGNQPHSVQYFHLLAAFLLVTVPHSLSAFILFRRSLGASSTPMMTLSSTILTTMVRHDFQLCKV